MFDWIQTLADWLIYQVFAVDPHSKLGDALTFFIYDTLKILLLLFMVTFVMGLVNSYIPIDRIRNFLSRNRLYGAEYFMASLFGALTPFCSCSSVPLFIGFVKGGIPLGVTFAFLITSPLVNEVAIALFIGMFGLKATLLYVGTGIVLGVVAGAILGRLHLEGWLSDWVQNLLRKAEVEGELDQAATPLLARIPQIGQDALAIIRGVWLYVIVGIGVGAAMHGFIPTGFFEQYISASNPLAVPLAVVIGVPMYSNAAGVLPIIQVLVQKGVPMGTAVAFMMAVVGLSIPEAMLLKKVMSTRLIAAFFGVVTVCIILSGYFFNWLF